MSRKIRTMKRPDRENQLKTFAVAVLLAGALALVTGLHTLFQADAADATDEAGAREVFLAAVEVLYHPRCLNCHPSGDGPLIRDDSRPHLFNVKRGPEGKGVDSMKCTLCHRDTNQAGGSPGVPNWHMPPEAMPMTFQGRTPAELCRQLKDPKQNGGRTGVQIVEHISKDPLVLWGWNPGEGRTIPKLSHKEFSAKMNEWANKGAACPQ